MSAARSPAFALDTALLPPAWISAEQADAFIHLIRARAPACVRPSAAFATFTAMVQPLALAPLARVLDYADDAIAVLDEAQFSGRYVSLTQRPDWGFSLALEHRRDA